MQVLSNPSYQRKKQEVKSLLPKIIRELLDGGSPIARMTVSGVSLA